MNRPSDELLAVSPQTCCCSSLTLPIPFSAWQNDTATATRERCHSKSCHSTLYGPVDSITPNNNNNKICSSPKQSVTLTSSESKSTLVNSKLLLNYKIPYQFSHQTSSTTAIKDYQTAHTYPNLQRRVRSANSTERCYYPRNKPGYIRYTRSCSETQIATTLKPKTIVLGEYHSKSQDSAGKKQSKERTSPSSIPSSKATTCKSLSPAKTKPHHTVAIGNKVLLKMRWASHPQQPSKSRNNCYGDILKRHSPLKTGDEQLNKAIIINSDKGGRKSSIAPDGAGCLGDQKLIQHTDCSSIRSRDYRYYCQRGHSRSRDIRMPKATKNGVIKSPSSANPWGDNG